MSFLWMTWTVSAIMVVLLVAVLIFIAWIVKDYFSLRGNYHPSEDLIGQVGTVRKECTPHQKGKVYVAGAYWDAISEFGALHEGEDIRVVEFKEQFLVVKKVDLITPGQVK